MILQHYVKDKHSDYINYYIRTEQKKNNLYSYRLGKRWFSTFGLSLNNCSMETPRVSAI